MFTWLDKKILGHTGPWNCKSHVLKPENQKHDRPVILVHGFIGSPYDMKPLADALVRKGFRVTVPATPGQTWQTPLNRRNDYDKEFYVNWLSQIVAQETDCSGLKPFLAGLSMGGALSTIMASQGTVEKLALLAPFYKLPGFSDRIWHVSKRLSGVVPAIPKFSRGNINHPEGYRSYLPGSCFVSLDAFGHLGDIAFAARKAAPKIKIETNIFLSENDRVADSKMTQQLFSNMNNVHLHFLNRANHILLYDHGAETIICRTVDFFSNG